MRFNKDKVAITSGVSFITQLMMLYGTPNYTRIEYQQVSKNKKEY